MSRKVVLIIAAVLLACAPIVGGIAAVGFIGPRKTLDWAHRQIMLISVRGGPEVVFEIDADAVRQRSNELLRRSVVAHLREARLRFNARLTDTGVDVLAEEPDRQKVVSVLGSKLAPSTGIRLAGDGRVQIALSETALAGSMIEAAEQSEAVLTGRLLELGMTALVTVQPQPTGARLLVQIARTDDPQRVVAVASKPGETTFRLIDVSMAPEAALTSTLPAGTEILFGREIDGRLPHLVEKRPIMTGRDLVDAQPRREARTGEPIVTFRFSPAGARKFAQVTGENIGRPMAIVVDNEVLSAPVIREPITRGSGQISGNFTPEAANELAAVLRYGELPARLKVVGQTAKESAR